jgi:hypothetical protein
VGEAIILAPSVRARPAVAALKHVGITAFSDLARALLG